MAINILRYRSRFLFLVFLCLTSSVILLVTWENGLTGILLLRTSFSSLAENAEVEIQLESSSFVTDWCRVRKARLDWKELLKPCSKYIQWSSKVKDTSLRTNATTSTIVFWELNPSGRFSRFVIQSRTKAKIPQKSGGDSWLVRIKGEAYISATVIDHDNGTYEVLFLPMEPGDYQAQIRLDYSLCDGYRDPPPDWFIIGNSQGKHQPEGTLGTLDDYLLEPLGRKPLHEFSIKSGNATLKNVIKNVRSNKLVSGCGSLSCRFLWDGYGRWLRRTWMPLVPGSLQQPRYRDTSKGKGIMWFYGDSLNYNRYRYNFNDSELCKDSFDQCSFNINFIYHIKYRIELDTTETDELDFNVTRVLDHFRSVLLHPRVNHVNSVIVLNMGLHYVMGLTFERYQDLIQRTIGVIKENERSPHGKLERRFKGHVIWLTTTAINKENAKELQATKWRFCTYQRVILFNAYATSAMCEAGIDIVDMYPITDSYPDGTYDVVHYRPPASQPIVSVFQGYLGPPLQT
ncbi:uncharacterized protein LOC116302232 [Actinia tenebrosa]|uniref:Uncharacterized protein LOC116302232 n=1 Tax=Actinia tenebrosa TaxID=6105 RepID=A0A6P8IKP0_ACTTE|nr:uncharacterized protein LOC116302232 [Actinia tenebrosa]